MVGRGQDDKGFLSRWAERKRDARQDQDQDQDQDQQTGDAIPGGDQTLAARSTDDSPAAEGRPDFDLKDLPDVESLGKESDFSVFMNEKVPDALRRRALRRLWRVDPLFGFRDGMNDYDEDYTDAAMVVEGMKTIYQVGKGMVTPEEPDESEASSGMADQDVETAGAADSSADADSPVSEAPAPDQPASDQPVSGGPDSDQPVREISTDQQDEPLSAEGDVIGDSKQATGPLASPFGPPLAEPMAVRRGGKSAVRRRWGDNSG